MNFYVWAVIVLLAFVASARCSTDRIVSLDNGNGKTTYATEQETDPSIGSVADSVISLLTKDQGWVADDPATYKSDDDLSSSGSEYYSTVDKGFEVGITAHPHLEILQLIETFIRLKGEVAGKLYQVLLENSGLFKSIFFFAVSKIGHLHKFTLSGIVILRRILQFAADLFGHWGLPSLSVALNKPITAEAYVQTPLVAHTNNYHPSGPYEHYGRF